MFKKYFETIDGVAFYPIISLIIFFTVFTLMLVYVFRMKKSYVDDMKNMPLDDSKDPVEPHNLNS